MAGQQFMAYNSALSTTTNVDGGTSYSTGAKVALQLAIPANGQIALVEWGCTLAVVQTTATIAEVASTATASTVSTAHTTTTVIPAIDNYTLATSKLTMGTGATGFGNGAITSNTTLRPVDRQNIFSGYGKIWPLEDYPRFGGASAQYLQFRLSTAATVSAIVWARWIELI